MKNIIYAVTLVFSTFALSACGFCNNSICDNGCGGGCGAGNNSSTNCCGMESYSVVSSCCGF